MKTTVGKCSYINLNQTVRSSFDLRKCDPRVSVSLWEMRIAKFRRSRAYKGKAGTEKNASSPCSLLEGADSEAFARGSVDQWHVTMFPLECLIHYLNFHQSLASSNFRRMLVAAIYHGAAEVDSPVSLFALLSTGSQEITLRRDCCRLKRRQRVTITPSHCAFLRTTLWCIATRIVIRERDGTRTHVMRTVYSLIRPAGPQLSFFTDLSCRNRAVDRGLNTCRL